MILRGHVSEGFAPVRDAFLQNFEDHNELGAGFAVCLNGEWLIDIHGGYSDRARDQEWTADTLVPVYSTTKGISALVLGWLIGQSDTVTYESSVSEIWPEFGANGKEAITIAEVASHQAGLPGFDEEIDPEIWLDPPACAAALAACAPMWERGTAHGYHPLSWGYLVGEIARRLDPDGISLGQRLATFTGTNVNNTSASVNTLSADFWIGLPESEHGRCAELRKPKAPPDLGELNRATLAAFVHKWSAPNRGGAAWRRIEIPSANGHGTARSVAQLYSAYTGHGPLAASADLTRPRVEGQDLVLPLNTKFAAGVMCNNHGLFGPNPNTFGHSGWGGSMAIADPDLGLTCAYVMNQQSPVLVGDPRARRLVEAVYACL